MTVVNESGLKSKFLDAVGFDDLHEVRSAKRRLRKAKKLGKYRRYCKQIKPHTCLQ